jgi:CDP-glucose 4,6-dehydratase
VGRRQRAVENVEAMIDFFAGKRVLVTGHTGFKGSWLSAWLLKLGAEVTGYALAPLTAEDHFVRLGLEKRMRHIEGDLLDTAKLNATFRGARPEFVFHLAAQALVRRSYAEPKLTFDTNVTGGVNLLESVRATPEVRTLVFITSDKCYRNHEWVWGYRESDELGGDDPYSASKAAAELVFRSYAASFFANRENFAAATARAGNVIGGGDYAADRIVPDCIRALHGGQPIIVRRPEATRPWQHVMEPLSGYLALARALSTGGKKFGGGWNFGPVKDSNRSVRDLVERVIAGWGGGEMKIERPVDAPHESRLLHLNCDKAHGELGWRPTWHFAEGVDETTRWYREAHNGADAWALTTGQIAAYEAALAS